MRTILNLEETDKKIIFERLFSRITKLESGCWLYSFCKKESGYARLVYKQKQYLAHRTAYELIKGEIPEGKILDHTCHDPKICAGGKTCAHRACINPEHLAPTTKEENTKPGRAVSNIPKMHAAVKAKSEKQTHCVRGHLRTEKNTKIIKGTKYCKDCWPMYNKKAREKRKLLLSADQQLKPKTGFTPARY